MPNEFDQVNKKIYNYTALNEKIWELGENPTQICILMLFSKFINSERHFFMNYETISKSVKVSRKSIQREIAKLLDLELIFIVKKSTQHSPYVFRLSDVFFDVFRNQTTNPDRTGYLSDRTNWTSRQDNLSVQTGQIGPLNVLMNVLMNDDGELRAKGPSASSKIEIINSQKSEQPKTVLKESFSVGEFCELLKVVVIDRHDKSVNFFRNSLIGDLNEKIDRPTLCKIIEYIQKHGLYIRDVSISSSEDLSKKIQSIQERMNGVPKQTQGEPKIDLTYNLPPENETLSHEENLEESGKTAVLPNWLHEIANSVKK